MVSRSVVQSFDWVFLLFASKFPVPIDSIYYIVANALDMHQFDPHVLLL